MRSQLRCRWLRRCGNGLRTFRRRSSRGRVDDDTGAYRAPRTSGAIRICKANGRARTWWACRCNAPKTSALATSSTTQEFQERQAQFAQQREQDNADFELENAANTPGGAVGGPVSRRRRIGSSAASRSVKHR